MSGHPDVDVIVPTRDRPTLLRGAIKAILGSEYDGRVRVLVVYDQSTPDETLETDATLGVDGESRSVIVLQNTRTAGLAGARNSGLMAAVAELVAFCDDDDTWRPHKLATQVAALHDHPTAELVCGGIEVSYDGTGHPRVLDQQVVTLTDLLRDRLTELHPSTFLMRRKAVVDGFGLVDEEIPGSYAEDYEFLLRAARSHPILNVQTVVVDVLWSKASYFSFTTRWQTVYQALTWLLQRYPEFASVPAGEARVMGQIGFALAAGRQRREGARWAGRAIRRHPTEPRAYLALGVASGLISPDWVLRRLHHTGRGI
jgi:glycosyltransferase involved in cell wall biosynthesis